MQKIYLQTYLVIVFALFVIQCFSSVTNPVSIDSVDYGRIPHKKVRQLLLQQKRFGIHSFNEIIPVCYSPDSGYYRTFTKSKLIRQDISIVWNNLTQVSPKEEFDGKIVKFGLLYSKRFNHLLYRNESKPGIEEGQILFFNLRVLSGIKNLAVALEVTQIDNSNKKVEYCYIDHGNTKGTQTITLKTTPEGYTEITQVTQYKCKTSFRNNIIYAFFHEKIVNELFDNIQHKSEVNLAQK